MNNRKPLDYFLDLNKCIYDWRETDALMGMLRRPVFGAAAPSLADSGKDKVVLLHKVVEDVIGYFPVREQTIGDCFVAGTMVSGPDGTKPIEDVEPGDRVFTGTGRITKVLTTRAKTSFKPLVRVSMTSGESFVCTEDHQIMAYRLGRVSGKAVTSASYERAISGCPGLSCDRIIEEYESREPVWVKAGELNPDDSLLTPLDLEPDSLPGGWLLWGDSQAAMWLYGYFAGNGHASGGSVEIAVPDDEMALFVHGRLADIGIDAKIGQYRPDTPARRVRVHCRKAVEFFRSHFYDENSVKLYPDWARGSELFLEGLLAADGSMDSESARFDSTSPSLAYGVFHEVIRLGNEPGMSLVSRSKGTYENAKPLRRVQWKLFPKKQVVWRDQEFSCRRIRSVEPIEGPAVVYDIGVEDEHHSFLANGIAVHNCVSMGYALGVDVLKCVEIKLGGERETYETETATEPIYASSRVEIGRGRLGNSDGSIGAWAARAVNEYGTLLRRKYGRYDLSKYSGSKAREWGKARNGLPDALEPTSREHPVRTVSLVNRYEEARDAIANGYPVPVCSMQGFSSRRDREGFAKPSGSWAHCMCFVAVDDRHRRPGLLCVNSWGSHWISGPKRHGQPDGSFWVDADVADKMLRRDPDSYSLSGFDGYRSQDFSFMDVWA